jgi:putative ABC transport system substrate-binding protein
VGLNPDVILASSPLVLQPLLQETRSIPIVFTQITDPVGSGFVASLARPGGNITGFAVAEFSMYGKSLEMLKEVAPDVARVAVLFNPEQVPQAGMWHAIEAVAPSFRVELTAAAVRNSAQIERAISSFARESNGGLIVLPNVPTIVHRGLIIALAARHRLPAVYAFRQFVTDGGLISYGPHRVDQYRQAAGYVDRILRGEKPADLPVQQPLNLSWLSISRQPRRLVSTCRRRSSRAPTRSSSETPRVHRAVLLGLIGSILGWADRKGGPVAVPTR